MKLKLFLPVLFLLFSLPTHFSKGENLFVKESSYPTGVLERQKELDKFYSNKKLGAFVKEGKTYFRLFTPSPKKVELLIFETPESTDPKIFEMKKDENAVWETVLDGELYGAFYGFKVFPKNYSGDGSDLPLCVDPYAKAVTTFTTYMNPRKAIIIKDDYNWEGDEWIQRDWRDLIIYEMHIRDMTAHPSAKSKLAGTYKGLIDSQAEGGINYIKKLGVNTVELLPAMEYGYLEIPYKDSTAIKYNTWNPYERNHWGYMTSNFFAPASYYSQSWKEIKKGVWMGAHARQVNDFKDMVKAFHREGIGVMMDVVFNHLSEYEVGNLKQIDKEYYFRLDENGNFISKSYCGNDLRTEAPMLRRLIVESVLFWMKEYHIDGFRFDLGKLIDWKTIEEVIKEARKVNPYVVFVCEPWGGGYDPTGFSKRGWGAWNDQIRNGVKGQNLIDGLGWIFGKWYSNNNIKRIESYVNGTLLRDKFGLFLKKEHSVNYLESHDDYTFGDFIRIAVKKATPDEVIKNVDEFVKLSPRELKLNKLGALFLLTSQGITMIAEGQEFARTKVIPLDVKVPDLNKGHIDHNSYNKDNATNYINYNHAKTNNELLQYYRGLIELRTRFAAFRRAKYEDVNFVELKEHPFALGYFLNFEGDKFFVGFNAQQKGEVSFSLPNGTWSVLVNGKQAGVKPFGFVKNKIKLPPVSGVVLKFLENEK